MLIGPGPYSPIGIDLGAGAVKAAQLRRGRSEIRLEHAALVGAGSIDDPAARVARAADVLRRRGFVGRRAVIIAPRSAVVTAMLDVPPRSSGAPVDEIVEMELARAHALTPGAFEMASWDLPGSGRASNPGAVLAGACAHEAIEPLLEAFDGAGIEIIAVDTEASVIARLASAVRPGPGVCSVAVDIGWGASVLVVLVGGTVVYQRVLPELALARLHAELRDCLGADDEVARHVLDTIGLEENLGERASDWALLPNARRTITDHACAIAHEIRAAGSYAAHQYRDAEEGPLLLAGAGAAVPGLARWLGAETGLEARRLDPSLLCTPGGDAARVMHDPRFGAAVALAARFDR